MAVLELRCIAGFDVETVPSGIKKTFTYRPFTKEIDTKKYGTYNINCPSCGDQFELIVFPGLSLLKAIKVGMKETNEGMGLKLNLLFIFLFPLAVILLVLFPKLFEFVSSGGLVTILSFLFLLAAFVMFIFTSIQVLSPLQLKCFIPGGLRHQVLLKGKNISVPANLETLSQRIPYYK